MAEQTFPAVGVDGGGERVHIYTFTTGSAGADIADRPVFVARKKCRCVGAKIVTSLASAAIDGSNTCAIALQKQSTTGTNLGSIFSKTLSANTTAEVPVDLGNPDATYWELSDGQQVVMDVTQGTNADLDGSSGEVTLLLYTELINQDTTVADA